MKIILKIIGVIVILFVALVVYFIYQAASERGAVDNIIDIGAEYYNQYKSYDGFCDLPELVNAESNSFKVSCKDSAGEIDLQLSTEDYIYSCKSAVTKSAEGLNTKRLACVKTGNLSGAASETNATLGYNSSNKFDSSLAIDTSQDPQVCTIPRFTDLEKGPQQFERAIMPGVYTSNVSNVYIGENVEGDKEEILKDFALSNSLAVKRDGSVCYCNLDKDDEEIVVSEDGVINEDGIIKWSGNKISKYANIKADITVGKLLVSLVDTDGSYTARAFQLGEDGCRGGSREWEPFAHLTEDEVCGCAI